MTSLWEFEREKMERLIYNLFWAIEDWVDSIKKAPIDTNEEYKINTKVVSEKQEWETIFQRGFIMHLSKLAPIVDENYRRLRRGPKPTGSSEWNKICLNDAIRETADEFRPIFEIFETRLVVAETPKVTVWIEKLASASPILFVIWWLLDVWPNSKITVNFMIDDEKARIVFQDSDKVHIDREFKDNHKILLVWSYLIEHLIVVEAHGRCIWPQVGEARRLEIIFPLRPPTEQELNAPVSKWLK